MFESRQHAIPFVRRVSPHLITLVLLAVTQLLVMLFLGLELLLQQQNQQLLELGISLLLFVVFTIMGVRFVQERGQLESMLHPTRDHDELARERNLMRTVLDNLPDVIFAHDREGKVLLDNLADARFIGVQAAGDVVGRTLYDHFPPELAARYDAQNRAIIETGKPLLNDEQVGLDSSGNKRWFLVNKVPLRDEQGSIIGVVGIARDITERKQMQEAFDKEQSLLRTVIDNLPDLVFVKDKGGRNILNNLADARFVGAQSPQELAGKRIFDFFPPEVAESYHGTEQQILSTGEPQLNHEEQHTDSQGNRRWFITSKVPLRDSQGEIIGLVGIARDITERKQVEEALAAERNLLRTVIDNLPDHVYVKDTNSRFLLRNRVDIELLNVSSPDELIGKSDFDLFAREVAEQTYAEEQALMASGQPIIDHEQQVIFVEPTKEDRWAVITKVPLRDANGKVIGLVGINHDITERKRAEQQLAKERSLLETVIDNLPDSIFVKDRQGRNILVNTADSRFSGATSREALIGKSVFDFFPPERAAQFHAEEDALMASGQGIFNQEESGFDPSGKLHWFLMTKVPLRDSQGQVIGLVGIARDITERKQVEDALKSSEARFRALVKAIPDLIFRVSKDGVYLDFHAEKPSDLALPPETIIGSRLQDSTLPKDVVGLSLDAIRQALETEQRQSIEYALTMPTGLRHYEARIVKGSADEVVAIVRDITERKQAEQTLAEERNLLRTVIDTLPDLIYVRDLEGHIMLVNEAAVRFVGGKTYDDLLGKTDFDFYESDRATRYFAEEQAMMHSGKPIVNQEEFVVEARTGNAMWVSATKVPLRRPDGSIIGMVGISRDISARKEAEQALAQERNLLRTVIDNIPDYIYVKDTRGRFILRNISGVELLGVKTADEIIGKTDFDFFPRELAEEFYVEEQIIIETGHAIVNQEVQVVEPVGGQRWLLYTKVPLRDSQGNIVGVAGVSRDINERKAAEEALKQAHDQLEYERAQLQAILDSMGEGVIYDENLQTRYINQALTRLTGYSVEEWQSYLHPLKSDRVIAQDFEALNRIIHNNVGHKGVWRGEMRLQRKDGSEFDAGLTCTEVTGIGDAVVGAVTIVRDISAEKALQEQKSRFVANASHELRTPITNLKTRLYLLRKQPEKMDYHLQVIEEVTGRMQRLVEDMLDVSRFERGLIPLYRREVALQDLVSDVVEVQRAEAERKRVHLKCELPTERLYVLADPERMTQVITNIVVNAINYTPEGGFVFVYIVSEDGRATLHVRDTGIGIAPEQLQQVFQPFFRASQGVSGGTGLGLTIVKDIVELHGGTIEVESQVGQGSRFTVKLDLTKKTP